jgi:hypothetical protein
MDYLQAALLIDSCKREVLNDENLRRLPEPFLTAAIETLCLQRRIPNYTNTETDGEMDFNKSQKRQRQH